MDAKKIINWGELSRTLSGSRSVVTKNRMPKKHEKSVAELLNYITVWYDSLQPDKADTGGEKIKQKDY
jgi:hypothetical protein